MSRAEVGYFVWSPEGRSPTYVHPTFSDALTEAQRLKRIAPHQRFYVMSPVDGLCGATTAMAFDQGRAEGLAQAHREIIDAEARSDRVLDELGDLRRLQSTLAPILRQHDEFQAAVADCILWFDGFTAAHVRLDPWERPSTPERARLTALNSALQMLRPQRVDMDEEIPF